MQKGIWSNIWGAGGLVLAAVLLIVQLLQWKKHGDDLIFVAIGIGVTVLVWAICVYAIVRNVKDAQRAASLHAQIQTIKDDHKTELEGLRRGNAGESASVRNQMQAKVNELKEQLAETTQALADEKAARERDNPIIGQAAILRDYADVAEALVRGLENCWHMWNASHKVLSKPLAADMSPQVAGWRNQDVSELLGSLVQFRACYEQHLGMVGLRFPKFSSNTVRAGYPCEDDYNTVRHDLYNHMLLLSEQAEILASRRLEL